MELKGNIVDDILTITECPERLESVVEIFGQDTFTEIIIPDNVHVIGQAALRGASKLETITIPTNVKIIGPCAFMECGSLKHVIIPETVQTVGSDAFAKCVSLESVIFEGDTTELSCKIFRGCCNMKTAVLPRSLRGIRELTFFECRNLTDLTVGELHYVDLQGFANCNKLKQLRLAKKFNHIKHDTFFGCGGLELITYCDDPHTLLTQMKSVHDKSDVRKLTIPPKILISQSDDVIFRYLLDHADIDELSDLLCYVGLQRIEQLIEHSINDGTGTRTAVLLDYKNKHYNQEDLDRLEYHQIFD